MVEAVGGGRGGDFGWLLGWALALWLAWLAADASPVARRWERGGGCLPVRLGWFAGCGCELLLPEAATRKPTVSTP